MRLKTVRGLAVLGIAALLASCAPAARTRETSVLGASQRLFPDFPIASNKLRLGMSLEEAKRLFPKATIQEFPGDAILLKDEKPEGKQLNNNRDGSTYIPQAIFAGKKAIQILVFASYIGNDVLNEADFQKFVDAFENDCESEFGRNFNKIETKHYTKDFGLLNGKDFRVYTWNRPDSVIQMTLNQRGEKQSTAALFGAISVKSKTQSARTAEATLPADLRRQ